MAGKYEPIEFQGPRYGIRNGAVANAGLNISNNIISATGRYGYHDLDQLGNLVDTIFTETADFISTLEDDLEKYSLILDLENEYVQRAFSSAFPSAATPYLNYGEYIHFYMYKYLLKDGFSSAAEYLRTIYEVKMREPSGSWALDFLKLLLYIRFETIKIDDFVKNTIGELDDTSEYRVLEVFQDWSEDATFMVAKLRQAYEQGETISIPHSELDIIDKDKANRYQALFKVKLNELNRRIQTDLDILERDFFKTKDYFYDQVLTQALKFRLKITKEPMLSSKTPTLSTHAENTFRALDSNLAVVLADYIRRRINFRTVSDRILSSLIEQVTYCRYIKQLANIGSKIPVFFTEVILRQSEKSILDEVDLLNDNILQVPLDGTNFDHSHFSLTDLDNPDAHTQYLLKTGGRVTGNLELDSGVRIGGIEPAYHRHSGQDGSTKIRGEDIEVNSITADNVDSENASTSIPDDLAIVRQAARVVPPGITQVTVELSFDVDTVNIVNYEFEITRIN